MHVYAPEGLRFSGGGMATDSVHDSYVLGWAAFWDELPGRSWLCDGLDPPEDWFFRDQPSALEAGWEVFQDPDSGEPWLWHSATGRWFMDPVGGEFPATINKAINGPREFVDTIPPVDATVAGHAPTE